VGIVWAYSRKTLAGKDQGVIRHGGNKSKYGWLVKFLENPGYNNALPVVLFTSK
jgi:hypothetical protein